MTWELEQHDSAIVAWMNTNPVNAQNQDFFDDLNRTLDQIEREHEDKPLVLASRNKAFSAGLDFRYAMPLFARNDRDEIASFFHQYVETNLRLFTLPRPTIAAIGGHAIAGGLITALMCDVRIAAEGTYRLGLNEVLIGIPMPAIYVELLRHALGESAASQVALSGQLVEVGKALSLNLVQKIVPAEHLLNTALKVAESHHPDTNASYAFTKRALRNPALLRAQTTAAEQDQTLIEALQTEGNRRTRAKRYTQVTGETLPE